jgi:glycosyltransferase involved in cell wall biosynthesis
LEIPERKGDLTMKILFWTVSHLPDLGGFQWSTFRLAKSLKAFGHEVVFLTKTEQACHFDNGMPAIRMPCSDIQGWVLKSGRWILANTAIFNVLHVVDLFYQSIDSQIDFILKSGKPNVVKIPTLGYVPKLINNSIRERFCSIDAFIALSDGIKEELIGCGVAGENIYLIPNGISTVDFSPATDKQKAKYDLELPESKILILFAGRLVWRKRVDILLEAMKKMPERFHLVIVGSSFGQRDSVEEQILQEAAKFGNITVRQATADILKYYQACDINVLLSEREGSPNSILEGMSCGMATVATNIHGISNAITNGEEGILVPVADVGKTINALLRVGSDRDLMSKMGQLARIRIQEKFAIEIVANTYLDLYRNVSKRKGV